MAVDQHASVAPMTGRRVIRWVTVRYAVALVVIALLTLGSHAVLERLTVEQEVTGAQVNVAGRQRMLSQHIAAQALARAAPATATATATATRERLSARLVADADEMVAAQRALLAGDGRRGLPGDPSPALRALYREGEDGGVEQAVGRYADLARAVARTPADDEDTPPLVADLMAQADLLLPALDEVVDAYEAQGRDRVATTTRTSWLLLGLTLAVLVAEALAVFAPLARRLRATVDDLESTGARLRATVDTATVGVLTLDGRGRVTDVNDALLRLLGSSRARVVGTALSEHVDPATADAVSHLVTEAAAGGRPRSERTVLSESRRSFVAELTAATTPPGRDGERSTVVVVTDVTERHAAEQVLLHRAQHDQLTGLPTRAVVEERLLRATVRSRSPRLLALLALDLDGFKAINDVHGHAVGDAVLVAVARRAVVALREGDTVARFGGDEFVVLLEEVDSAASALAVAQRLAAALREPVTSDGVTVSVGVSIGVAVARAGGPGGIATADAPSSPPVAAEVGAPELAQMLRRADLAMYVTKKAGDERPRVYHGRMEVAGQPVEAVPAR